MHKNLFCKVHVTISSAKNLQDSEKSSNFVAEMVAEQPPYFEYLLKINVMQSRQHSHEFGNKKRHLRMEHKWRFCL